MNHALVEELQAKIEILEEEIIQLREHLAVDMMVRPEWGLIHQEIIVFRLLATRELLTRDSLRYALWAERDEPKNLIFLIAKVIAGLRRKLKPYGFKIKVFHSIGWTLVTPEDRR
ncbi:MAG: hypothetical protein BGN87_18365 [Rhizobiales bacterium 65-79]|nr:hypothetical protein [Hyphomicrobiales bacterium]OJU03569.1 MAG: hypothetical protein BGN87_18365 [Rhizobiales bacterium 65-79]